MTFTTVDMTLWLKNRLDKILGRKETDVNFGSVSKCGSVTIDCRLQCILCRIEAYEKRKTGIDFKSYTAPVKVNIYHIIHLSWLAFILGPVYNE